MVPWIKAHWKQLATLVLWSAAMVALYKRPQWKDEIVMLAGALQLVGMQLPPFTLKPGQAVKAVGLTVIGVLLIACAARTVAKDAYWLQSESCLQSYSDVPSRETCLKKVRDSWTEAGAPPAATVAIVDAGQVSQ